MRSLRCALVIFVTTFALFMLTRPAVAAPSKEGCVSANEDADVLRRRGSLRAARVSLLACSAPECPRIVRDDCVARLEEVDTAMPTILFTAVENGIAVTDVAVGFDRKAFADHLYAEPLPADPGEHAFTFERKGYPIQTRQITLKEGEKEHREAITFGSATVSAPQQGRLIVTAEAGSAITIDGLSPVNERFDGMLAPGKHEVAVRKPGKRPYSKSIDVKATETQTVHVVLEPEERQSLTPWLIGGAIVVVAAIVVGGILIASGSGNDATARPGSTATGLSVVSF